MLALQQQYQHMKREKLTSSSCNCAKPFNIFTTTGVHAAIFLGLVS